jgi:hypothetical protein
VCTGGQGKTNIIGFGKLFIQLFTKSKSDIFLVYFIRQGKIHHLQWTYLSFKNVVAHGGLHLWSQLFGWLKQEDPSNPPWQEARVLKSSQKLKILSNK